MNDDSIVEFIVGNFPTVTSGRLQDLLARVGQVQLASLKGQELHAALRAAGVARPGGTTIEAVERLQAWLKAERRLENAVLAAKAECSEELNTVRLEAEDKIQAARAEAEAVRLAAEGKVAELTARMAEMAEAHERELRDVRLHAADEAKAALAAVSPDGESGDSAIWLSPAQLRGIADMVELTGATSANLATIAKIVSGLHWEAESTGA